jgi:hypothetical protein
MKSEFYLPILKSKLGEFTALSKLNHSQKEAIAPLFEITPLEWDQTERKVPRTLHDHLDSFCKKISTKWPSSNCFIDSGLLLWNESDNRKEIEYVFDKLSVKGIRPCPIATLTAPNDLWEAVLNIIKKHGIDDVGIRITPKDVTALEFNDKMGEILEYLGLLPSNCHLIFDLADSNFSDVDNFSDAVLAILETFPYLVQWKSFTIAGTAFPSSNLIKEGITEFSRNEWMLYLQLLEKTKNSEFKRPINFGDYSIVHPGYFEFNPKIMKASANIRYTHNQKWVVVKGKALKESADYGQYFNLSKKIYESNSYLGESFSDGDLHIAKCVNKQEGPGAPSVWNWVGNNHHFVKVLYDLSARSLAS